MIELYPEHQDHLPEDSTTSFSDEEVLEEIKKLKEELKEEVIVLGHHYQQDDIIQFADETGDSLALAKKAAAIEKPYVIFCGVHFMAETADMLTSKNQKVLLPDLNAGCTMADMATTSDVSEAFSQIEKFSNGPIIPITYINCSAALKAFVGEKGGSICTSSNATSIIKWALSQGEKLFFFPDQHLGRNTCFKLGISLNDMVVYNPHLPQGGLTPSQIKDAKVILWYGFCSVHQGFTKEHIKLIKNENPKTEVLVHPECSFDVFHNADDAGSTAYIIEKIKKAKRGTSFAIGTEINLVNRLAKNFPDLEIKSLSPYQCLCTTMYRVRPRWLLASFQSIKQNCPRNIIKVSEETKEFGLKAIHKMLELS